MVAVVVAVVDHHKFAVVVADVQGVDVVALIHPVRPAD